MKRLRLQKGEFVATQVSSGKSVCLPNLFFQLWHAAGKHPVLSFPSQGSTKMPEEKVI